MDTPIVCTCRAATQYQQLQDALVLMRYEAQKWKEQYYQEKERRLKLARSLIDQLDNSDNEKVESNDGKVLENRQRSSSAFTDKDPIETLLSPTLSSFDFDDDESRDGDEEDGEDDTQPLKENLIAPTRPTLMRVRPKRSSTIGAFEELRKEHRQKGINGRNECESSAALPPRPLLYRMLCTKTSLGDLWSSSSKLHTVARSIMFSLQLKKEHVFEHFFVVGVSVGKTERDHAAKTPTGMVGYWKPRVLAEYPLRAGRAPDSSVADFCFPLGVPVTKCKPHQVSALQGAPVSIWSTDADVLHKHVLDPMRTSGYTFRLTGAKGEVLYGICVSVMSELKTQDDGSSDLTEKMKRSSCPTESIVYSPRSQDDSVVTNAPSVSSATPRFSRTVSETVRPSPTGAASTLLAPICYCFTSKFPFYRLHFAILKMIIENQIHSRHSQTRLNSSYEVTLTFEESLGVDFAVCRQPNTFSPIGVEDNGHLSSISTALHSSNTNNNAVLSDELSRAMNRVNEQHTYKKDYVPYRKSFSSNDLGSYRATNTCVVEKPVVVRLHESMNTKFSNQIHVGDILEAIDGISTETLSHEEAMDLLTSSPRPLKLRFHRLEAAQKLYELEEHPVPRQTTSLQTLIVPTSIDILHRVRTIKIGDPGDWTTIRLPRFSLKYQFPKRHAERWACGVVLRYIGAESIVKILAHLLREKQVVIMGDNSAKVSAVCTAILLLLTPYQWQSTYIPQLPSNLLDFLHSPVPFLVGCQSLNTTDEWPDVCFFDIDADLILAPIADHHITPNSIPNGEELCRLFYGAKERYNQLRPTSKPWHELSEEEDNIITLTMQESSLYLRDMSSALTSPHLISVDGKSVYERLQEQVAMTVRSSRYERFLEEFSQTQMFCEYCETALKPESITIDNKVQNKSMTSQIDVELDTMK